MKKLNFTVFTTHLFSYASKHFKVCDWYGGKTQSNGGLSLSWTAGEPVVGLMTSDNAQLEVAIILPWMFKPYQKKILQWM
jgi:hypothetical protein